MLVPYFLEQPGKGPSQPGMDEFRVYFDAGNEHEFSFVQSGVGYCKLRGIEKQVIKEKDIEVYCTWSEAHGSLSPQFLLRFQEKGEERVRRPIPSYFQHAVQEVLLGYRRDGRGTIKRREGQKLDPLVCNYFSYAFYAILIRVGNIRA